MEEALVKRIMPHSLEAEQSVIGSMIMDRDAILTASEQLVKDDFYHQQYGILFETITELFNSGAPVDLITLQNRLREKNVPPEISSLEYVGDLVTTVPTSANVKYYAEIVKEKAVLRKLIKINEQIADTCVCCRKTCEKDGIRGEEHTKIYITIRVNAILDSYDNINKGRGRRRPVVLLQGLRLIFQ